MTKRSPVRLLASLLPSNNSGQVFHTWSSGSFKLVAFRLRFNSHRWSLASNLEQGDNLLCAVLRSTQPRTLSKMTGAVVCLLAANRRSNYLLTRAMDGPILRCGIISSCQSAATSEIVFKALLVTSLTHVRCVVASTGPFNFSLLFHISFLGALL